MFIESVVIIPTYNEIDSLLSCIHSLKKQSYLNFKIVVVDDGSTENISSILQNNYSDIDIIINNINLGFVKSMNKGITHAIDKYDPTYIAPLNNDTVVDKDWLKELVKTISKDNNIASVASNMLFFDKKTINSQGVVVYKNGFAQDINIFKNKDFVKYQKNIIASCWGATLIRSSALKKVGLLDNRFEAYYDDVDWAMRANICGYRFVFCKNAIVYHHWSMTFGKHSSKKIYLNLRNMFASNIKTVEKKYLFKKYFILLFSLFKVFIHYFLFINKKSYPDDFKNYGFKQWLIFSLIPLRAFIWNIIHIGSTLNRRKKLQRERVVSDSFLRKKFHSLNINFENRFDSPTVKNYFYKQLFFGLLKSIFDNFFGFICSNNCVEKLKNKIKKTYLYNYFFGVFFKKLESIDFKTTKIKGDFGVNVLGYLSAESGVGQAARSIIFALDELDIDVSLINSPYNPSRKKDFSLTKRFAKNNKYNINLVVIYGDAISSHIGYFGEDFFRNKYNIFYWAWELDKMPNKWISELQYANEVWVPSNFVKDSLVDKISIPVIVVPHPIQSKKIQARKINKDFTFLFMFDFMSYFERKNPLAIIESFQKAFPQNEGVKLIIKCINSHEDKDNFTLLKKCITSNSRIELIDGYLSREKLDALFLNSDCYVSLHRSEGFGLTLAEAMSLGKPVIATNYSGNVDFMNEENSFLVDYTLVKLKKNYGPYKKGNHWAEPSISDAATKMRFVFENQDKAKKIGVVAKADVQKYLSPKAVKLKISSRLTKIKSTL